MKMLMEDLASELIYGGKDSPVGEMEHPAGPPIKIDTFMFLSGMRDPFQQGFTGSSSGGATCET